MNVIIKQKNENNSQMEDWRKYKMEKNNCELCSGSYDFRMVQINECVNIVGIALSGSLKQVNDGNRFKYCPKCGRKLTKENFGGISF